MSLQFPPDVFDAWASSYDRNVNDAGFPFEGYARVLNTMIDQSEVTAGMTILDLGAGTGNLAVLLADLGCRMWCLDFSAPMLEELRRKLPQAEIGQVDIRLDWPASFRRRYDRIVSGYTFHHLPLEEKVSLIVRLFRDHLYPNGRLVIGDIAFANWDEQDAVRRSMGDNWEEEYFWLADEAALRFKELGITMTFQKISFCAGVFTFVKEA